MEIVQTGGTRTKTGTAEHAEYYADDGKLILEKGQPKMVDNLRGTTQGQQLTWFSSDDRLLVNGTPSEPTKSLLLRK